MTPVVVDRLDSLLLVGEIVGARGLQGQLKIISWCSPRDNIFSYPTLIFNPSHQPGAFFDIVFSDHSFARGGRVLTAYLEGIETVDQTSAFIGGNLYVLKQQLVYAEDEYFWHEMIGMEVVNESGKSLGSLRSILPTGRQDVLEVCATDARYLIPFVREIFVQSVDRNRRVIQVNWDSDWLA